MQETGRSMVEMLGVLAIVGVLSIGGVLGYKYAMDKYRANETIDELHKRALIISGQALNGVQNYSFDELGSSTRFGYSAEVINIQQPPQFALILRGVPPSVCSQIVKSGWAQTIRIDVNTTVFSDDAKICSNPNPNGLMVFYFNHDLSAFKGAAQ